MCFFFFFFVLGKKKPSTKRLEEKRKCPPVLPETSGHESKRRAKNHASRRRRRRGEGDALTRRAKNVPIVGIVVTISPSLSLYKMVVLPAASRPTCVRFSASMREESLRSVPTHNIERERERKNSAQPTGSNTFHTFKKPPRATPRRGEAADVPPHRISQNSKTKPPAFFRPVGAPFDHLYSKRAIQNPILSLYIIVKSSRMPFDLTTSTNPPTKSDVRFRLQKLKKNSRAPSKCASLSSRRDAGTISRT